MKCWIKFHSRSLWQVVLLAIGAAMVCAGIFRGEAQTVLAKAIYICLECIGIG